MNKQGIYHYNHFVRASELGLTSALMGNTNGRSVITWARGKTYAGELLGVAIAKMLFGAIAAWIVKKITGIPAIPSYVVGVEIMSVVGGWLLSHDGFHTFIQAWILYLIGGVVALGLMIFGENKACQN